MCARKVQKWKQNCYIQGGQGSSGSSSNTYESRAHILDDRMTISKINICGMSDIMITACSSNVSYTIANYHHNNLLRLLQNPNGMIPVLTGIAAEEHKTKAEIECDKMNEQKETKGWFAEFWHENVGILRDLSRFYITYRTLCR